MKTEEAITTVLEGGAGVSPLGTHAFLDKFALAYHRAVAERLRAEPEAVLERARRTLSRWAGGRSEQWSRRLWKSGGGILGEADVDRLIKIMTDTSDEGQRLRSFSPFVGALSPEERLEILTACELKSSCLT